MFVGDCFGTVNMHAVNMHAVNMHAVNMHTVSMHTVNMHTVNMHTVNMHALAVPCVSGSPQSPTGLKAPVPVCVASFFVLWVCCFCYSYNFSLVFVLWVCCFMLQLQL